MKKIFVMMGLLGIWAITSCGNETPETEAQPEAPTKELSAEERSSFLEKGDSITTATQGALIKTLLGAIDSAGFEYAVGFCNVRALPITDSLSKQYGVNIARIARKNRNPKNALSQAEESVFDHYQDQLQKGLKPGAELREENGKVTYFKPILLGMPTCLKCHGPEEELDKDAIAKIRELYPDDKATGFQQGELRGLWKVEF